MNAVKNPVLYRTSSGIPRYISIQECFTRPRGIFLLVRGTLRDFYIAPDTFPIPGALNRKFS